MKSRLLAGAVLACVWLAAALWIRSDMWPFLVVVAVAIVVMTAAGANPFAKRPW